MNQQKTNEEHSLEEDLELKGLDDFFFHSADFFYRNRKLLSIIAGSVLVIALSLYGAYQFKLSQDEARAVNLYKLQTKLTEPGVAPLMSLKANQAALTEFIQNEAGTNEARIALLQRSNLYYAGGMLVEAEYDLRTLIKTLPADSGLYPVAHLYLSNILKDQDKGEEAVSLLKGALQQRASDVILIELAETYFVLGKYDLATQTVNDLKNQYPQSLFNQRADRLLESM